MSLYQLIKRMFCIHSNTILSRIYVVCKTQSRKCSIRRALFYVPGHDLKMLQRTVTLKLDCILMDCEDSVPLINKNDARKTIRKMFDEETVSSRDPEWGVRVNPVQTPDLIQADLETILSAKNLPISICLPKITNVGHLEWFAEKVWNLLIKRPENDRGPLKLILVIETANALLKLAEICEKAKDLSTMAPILPVALVFGCNHFISNIGASKSEYDIETLYARQKLVLVAKAFGLQAIDMIYPNFKSINKFKEECLGSAAMGFTGKQVIHQSQITVAQDAFVPSRQQIQWAHRIVKTFQNNQKTEGVTLIKDESIDASTLKLAENILNVGKAVGKYKADLEIETNLVQH